MVRIKHRYLLVNILYPEPSAPVQKFAPNAAISLPYNVQFRSPTSDDLNIKIIGRMIRDGVAELFGDYGSGKIASSLQVKYFSPSTSTLILRVAREHYRLIWTALTFITRLPKPLNRSCVMQVVRVSGTIKKAEEAAIRQARQIIREAQKGQPQKRTEFGPDASNSGSLSTRPKIISGAANDETESTSIFSDNDIDGSSGESENDNG